MRLNKIILFLALAIMAIVVVGCGSPAGVPAPPVELPTPIVIKFVEPEQLHINFDTISVAPSLSRGLAKTVGPGGTYSSLIPLGPSQVQEIEDRFFVPSLKGITTIDIPPEVTTFRDTVIFPDLEVYLSGTHDVALDFRPTSIDINGDGVMESCMGTSSLVPACILFWLDNVRYSVWRIEEPVSADGISAGTGFFRTYVDNLQGYATKFAIAYDQRVAVPDARNFEFFLNAVNNWGGGYSGSFGDLAEANYHLITRQNGADVSAYKSIDLTADIVFFDVTESAYTYMTMNYVGRYVEGYDLWSGSVYTKISSALSATPSFENDQLDICARISDGNAAEYKELCDNVAGFNLRDGNTAYIRAAQPDDFTIPVVFPATPTF